MYFVNIFPKQLLYFQCVLCTFGTFRQLVLPEKSLNSVLRFDSSKLWLVVDDVYIRDLDNSYTEDLTQENEGNGRYICKFMVRMGVSFFKGKENLLYIFIIMEMNNALVAMY